MTSPSRRWSEDRWARVAWSWVAEPGAAEVRRWVAELGAVEALAALRAGAMGAGSTYAARLAETDIDAFASAMRRLGVRAIVPGDDEWPTGLDVLRRPPTCLYARGTLAVGQALERSVAVVGARAATEYGTTMAFEIAEGLANRSATVVSGAAYGIDAAAHRGALAADGPTVAVLACGLDRVYPVGHAGLLARIAETGAVVSEMPLGRAPYRARFLERNRLIATMTLGTVVVEAGLRSGSLNTASHARTYHRHIAAVPGPVTSAVSAGCHELIRTGATLVTDAAEVLDLMGRMGGDAAPAKRAPDTPDGALSGQDHLLWSAVPVREAASATELSVRTGLSVGSVMGALGRLELLGLVRREGDSWLKVPPLRRVPAGGRAP